MGIGQARQSPHGAGSATSDALGWGVRGQEGDCPLPLVDSPAEAAGREIASQ